MSTNPVDESKMETTPEKENCCNGTAVSQIGKITIGVLRTDSLVKLTDEQIRRVKKHAEREAEQQYQRYFEEKSFKEKRRSGVLPRPKNQDGITFLKRIALVIVLIELMLALADSKLYTTFFLYVSLSSTFDMKPEHVLDTYCYQQSPGNRMCEDYMRRLTDNTSFLDNDDTSGSTNPSILYFSIPKGVAPRELTASESFEVFQRFNKSFYDTPARLSLERRFDKNSNLAGLYEELLLYLFNNGTSIPGKADAFLAAFNDTSPVFKDTTIFNSLRHAIELVPPAAPKMRRDIPLSPPLQFTYVDVGDSLPTARQEMEHVVKSNMALSKIAENSYLNLVDDNAPHFASKLRKNFIQKNLIRHRWKRNVGSGSILSPTPATKPSLSDAKTNSSATGKPKMLLSSTTSKPDERGRGTASSHKQAISTTKGKKNPWLRERISDVGTSSIPTVQLHPSTEQNLGEAHPGKEREAGKVVMKEVEKISTGNRKAPPKRISGNGRRSASSKWNPEHIITVAEENVAQIRNSKKGITEPKAGGGASTSTHASHGSGCQSKQKSSQHKDIEQLYQKIEKNPQIYMGLIESALFSNWNFFMKVGKQRAEQVADGNCAGASHQAGVGHGADPLTSLGLNMDLDLFSPEAYQRGKMRKRAVEQIYHDYSTTIADQLLNFKDMPVSYNFRGLSSAIATYTFMWQLIISMVLFLGSVYEDQTALNIWGILNILSSLLHFMVDDWINSVFHPEKTCAAVWFGVVYCIYKPLTVILVASLSAEILKGSWDTKPTGFMAKFYEIFDGLVIIRNPGKTVASYFSRKDELVALEDSDCTSKTENNNEVEYPPEEKEAVEGGGEVMSGGVTMKSKLVKLQKYNDAVLEKEKKGYKKVIRELYPSFKRTSSNFQTINLCDAEGCPDGDGIYLENLKILHICAQHHKIATTPPEDDQDEGVDSDSDEEQNLEEEREKEDPKDNSLVITVTTTDHGKLCNHASEEAGQESKPQNGKMMQIPKLIINSVKARGILKLRGEYHRGARTSSSDPEKQDVNNETTSVVADEGHI